jgi:hypothetical protein
VQPTALRYPFSGIFSCVTHNASEGTTLRAFRNSRSPENHRQKKKPSKACTSHKLKIKHKIINS